MSGKHLLIAAIVLLASAPLAYSAAPACATITPAAQYSSINIRRTPEMADNITGQLKRGQTAQTVRLTGSGWYELAIGGYIASSVTVCAADATPTRIPSSTPTLTPVIATPSFTRLWLDVDGSGDYETIIDCRQPCRAKLEQAP